MISNYDVSNQQLTRSARAGSAIMMSAVMSSQSAESYSATSRWYLKLAIAKRCRLDKWIRQRFAFALKVQSMDITMVITISDPVASTSRSTTGQPAAIISSPAGQPVASTSRSPADVPVASYSVPSSRLQCFENQSTKKPDAVVEDTTSSEAVDGLYYEDSLKLDVNC
ncbi:SMAD/FHA domain-containing protein [Dorcoceras hygrometricum]|uniref:SMAD/FHA domain-containing protein n=1 Tax=Dorcoceras hygrometricum TaxID=472368 RepID=A0A2Z7CTW2_9LAMI|nr:SMAD/FHA domain-containing protein [Dorcoceras hygrometricum]